MNVLIITPGFVFPLIGGQSIRTYNILRELKALGADITLVTIVEPGGNPEMLNIMREYCSQVIPVPVDSDRRLSVLEKACLRIRKEPATINRYHDHALVRAVDQCVNESTFDAVFCDQLHMAQYCHAIPIRKILNTDDPLYIQLRREAKITKSLKQRLSILFEAWKYKRYEKVMYSCFDHVLFVSAADRDLVRNDLGCSNIEIIPQGVDTSFFTPEGEELEDSSSCPKVIMTGTLNYGPNAQGVIYFVKDVLPLVRKSKPDVVCYIVGAYPSEEVKQLAENYRDVVVTGFVDDLRPYMRSADVYVSSSISGTGIKNKVLQAMSMGMGIVATPQSVDGIPYARHGENLLVEEGADALAAAVCSLLDDRENCLKLGHNARVCIQQHYAWAAIVQVVYELLSGLR